MTVQLHREISKIVIEEIHPSRKVEIDPSELPAWLGEYGGLSNPDTGNSARLIGVRLPGTKHIVSYADCYWRPNHDSTWKTWHLYIGVSHRSGLTITRILEVANGGA